MDVTPLMVVMSGMVQGVVVDCRRQGLVFATEYSRRPLQNMADPIDCDLSIVTINQSCRRRLRQVALAGTVAQVAGTCPCPNCPNRCFEAATAGAATAGASFEAATADKSWREVVVDRRRALSLPDCLHMPLHLRRRPCR